MMRRRELIKPVKRPPADADTALAGVTIRAREPGDYDQIAALMNLPKVRWGTLQLPFTSKEQWRKLSESPPDGMTCIVAELGGRLNVDNETATRMYNRLGFEVEGIRRADTFRGGRSAIPGRFAGWARLGAHTDEVLAELVHNSAETAKFRDKWGRLMLCDALSLGRKGAGGTQ